MLRQNPTFRQTAYPSPHLLGVLPANNLQLCPSPGLALSRRKLPRPRLRLLPGDRSQCQATTDKGLAPWTQDVSKGPSSSGASRGMGRALCHRSAPPSSKPASPAGLPLRALPAHLCVPRAESSSLFPGESELQYTFYMPGTKLAPWCARTQLILTEFER